MRHRLGSVITVGLLFASAAAQPTTRPAGPPRSVTRDGAVQLLRRMRTERDDVAFTGVRVLKRSIPVPREGAREPRIQVEKTFYRLVHADGRRWRSERLKAGADSPPVSVTIRRDGFSFIGKPAGGVWYKAALPPRDQLADLDLVLDNYVATLAGTEEVAGRQAVRVEIRPRWPNRPSLVLSVDAENQFRLRVVRLSTDGRPVSDRAYERIRFEVDAKADRFRPPPGARVVPTSTARRHGLAPVDFPVVLPEWLPEGFRPTAARVSTFRVRGPDGKMASRQRVQLGYGDGVTSISLFQTPMKRPPGWTEPYEATPQRDFWVLTGYRAGLRLTLLGEVGREDLARMLSSVGPSRRASRTREAGAPP